MASIPRHFALCVALCMSGCADDAGSDTTADGTSTGSDTTGSPTSMSASTTEPPGTTTDDETTTEPGTTTTGGETTGTSSTSGDESSSSTTAVEECRLQLVEVLYDAVGDDHELQWVKIYNPCGEAFDLMDFTIGWAGDAWDFGTLTPDRPVPIAPDGCALVGGPTSSSANGSPGSFDFERDFAPDLRLAPIEGSGVALFDVSAAEVGTAVPIDAVIYGDNNDASLIDTSGSAAAGPHVGLSGEGASLRRTDAGEHWEVAGTPSPEDCPPY